MVMSTKALKAIATVSIFALTIVASLLPYKIRSSKRVLSVLNVLAGGVFLGAGLAHLLADSADEFAEYAEGDHDHDHDDHDHDDHVQHGGDEDEPFPWAFVCCGIGFISTLAIEQIAHWLTHSKAEAAAPCGGHSDSTAAHHGHSHGAKTGDEDYLLADSINQDNSAPYSAMSNPESINDVEGGHKVHDHHHHHNHNHHGDDDHHGHSHVPLNTENQSFIIFIALWLALSYHSIVEGVVLGSSDQDTIKSIMVAILAHKGLESFALGTGLIRSGASKTKFVLFCLAFACMTPIGIGIGSLVSSTWSGPVKAAITGFGAGTFLYVAVVEVLLPEFNKQQDTFFKVLCLSAGFAGMSALAMWV